MPVANLNNVATQDNYVDALTVQFPRGGRPAFALNVANAAVFYRLSYYMRGDREPSLWWQESQLTPVFATFRDPTHEGLPAGSLFGGIQLRSAAAGVSARVTVM